MSGPSDSAFLIPRIQLPKTKCSVNVCNIEHRNDLCFLCGRAGLSRSYCDFHNQHRPNTLGIDHLSDYSMNLTVYDMLLENRILCKILGVLDYDGEVLDRKRFNLVVESCANNKWRCADLLGEGIDTKTRLDSLLVDILVEEKMVDILQGEYY